MSSNLPVTEEVGAAVAGGALGAIGAPDETIPAAEGTAAAAGAEVTGALVTTACSVSTVSVAPGTNQGRASGKRDHHTTERFD